MEENEKEHGTGSPLLRTVAARRVRVMMFSSYGSLRSGHKARRCLYGNGMLEQELHSVEKVGVCSQAVNTSLQVEKMVSFFFWKKKVFFYLICFFYI